MAILPFVQLAWVNSHGLFVLGPILLVFALIDALVVTLIHAVRGTTPAPRTWRWWRIVGIGSLATFAACLFNPYGVRGAVFPIELAGTMTNRIFSETIAELTPIPLFIRRAGLGNLPLQLHLLTMALGALSFLLPLAVAAGTVIFGGRPSRESRRPGPTRFVGSPEPTVKKKEKADDRTKSARKKATKRVAQAGRAGTRAASASWRLSVFRLLLFAAFSYLSLQATRNSHQFAAVVGTITAWNFGEWAAAIRRRRAERRAAEAGPAPMPSLWMPRLVAGAAIVAVIAWVGSGLFYRMTGEGRTIALGEEPLLLPPRGRPVRGPARDARRSSSASTTRHASLFEFYHGPERKVYTDPRLEVAGPELYSRYMKLSTDHARGGSRAGRPSSTGSDDP